MTKQIGFFGGTFDPIHLGHINLAIELMERAKLDEVWFCPAYLSPHKTDNATKIIAPEHRIKMVELSISDVPNFKVIDNEIRREGTSYTFDTLKELSEQNPEIQFRLLLGEDSLLKFDKWRRVEELVKLAPPIVASRYGVNSFVSDLVREIIENNMIRTPIIEMSSTDVRERLKKGLFCGHLIPRKVLDYIYRNRLYFY
jgi:nicotinate-nucleotide adenylyltransferase